ncbi:interferon alpha/beta receptor 1a-like [Silurus meridionalis]|uniref:Uncharacterized protein n=1 Tax=Silurus meridionalis TaxID=175797 RepID=A0A8T0BWW9_SILME|nr:interferon alpha/beta receptor 1a-like [Silurus meridionalis]KAF7709860.1 hypothetical protein HF521_016710 [Silurus meridionalis]KAI5107489.1 interferon alpha/beta receptor 1 isoform X2 [Silurus meridionalis]
MKLFGVFISALMVFWTSSVCGALRAPHNVTIQTLNMNYVLKWAWDPEQAPKGNVTFTTQYMAKFKKKKPKSRQDWRSVCDSSPDYSCDFSSAELHYLGMWLLRVRSQIGSDVSPWVILDFCPDRDAVIGPPSSVNITPVDGLLQVDILDPRSYTNGSMRELLPNMYYFIQYWKRGSLMQPNNVTSANNVVILPELENWTWYCVRVKSVDDYYKKISDFSPTYCTQTDGQTPYWQIFLIFLFSLVLSFGAILLLFRYVSEVVKVIRSTFYSTVPRPALIQGFLSDMPRLLYADPETEICFDRVDLLTPEPEAIKVDEIILEVHLPPETSQQSDRTHSRHSSGDSGVYSNEGSRQNDLGDGKMDKLVKKIARVNELDEGVQDMRV